MTAQLNKILQALDQTFAFDHKLLSSKVKTLQEGFDNKTNEHVIWLEYRIRVRNDPPPKLDPRMIKAVEEKKKSLLQGLLAMAMKQ